jgi:16S rRNA processing protein RimM
VFVPFSRAVVPTVDIAGGRLVIDPPDGLLDEPGEPPTEEGP